MSVLTGIVKRYDRTVVVLLMGLGMIFVTWLKMSAIMNDIVRNLPVIQEIKQREALHSVTDNALLEDMNDLKSDNKDMKSDLKKILRRMPREWDASSKD